MYLVSCVQDHPEYRQFIAVERSLNGSYETAELAVNAAQKSQRSYQETFPNTKVRLLIDEQIMTYHQAVLWARQEHHSLPKCGWCCKCMREGEVYSHSMSPKFFCTNDCSTKDYLELMKEEDDENECDFR